MLFPLLNITGDPLHHGIEDIFFAGHVQFITGDNIDQLIQRKKEEFFAFFHIGEMLLSVTIGDSQQLAT